MLSCDADKEVGKSEFVLYMMKFSTNRVLTTLIDQLDALIGQADVFNPIKRYRNDGDNIFHPMLQRIGADQLISGEPLIAIYHEIEAGLKAERRRVNQVRDARTSLDIGDDPHYSKSDDAVFQVEKVYAEVLAKAKIDPKGLSALEYVSMCLYYNYEELPEGSEDDQDL